MRFLDAAADLLLLGACPGCDTPGRGVCRVCVSAIMGGRIGPRHREGIDVPLWSAGDYAGPVARAITQAKDHHRWDAIDLLGTRLAFAVAGLADALGLTGPGVLVPFPSRVASVRARGLDFTYMLARNCLTKLRLVGVETSVTRLLTHVRTVQDQAELTSHERKLNLSGSLEAAYPHVRGWIVVVDDVVTTGASLSEAIRAMTVKHCPPVGCTTIAATKDLPSINP